MRVCVHVQVILCAYGVGQPENVTVTKTYKIIRLLAELLIAIVDS